ncbi:MAG: cell division inhibitor, partial [Saprospiraceae bacterium]
HKHVFKPLDNNTVKMNDELEYAIPMGPLGSIAHSLYVKNRLKEIFDYRYQKVDRLFNHFDISKRVDNTEKALSVQ